MFRSIKSAVAVAAVLVALGLTGGSAAVAADIVHTDGGTGCCRVMD